MDYTIVKKSEDRNKQNDDDEEIEWVTSSSLLPQKPSNETLYNPMPDFLKNQNQKQQFFDDSHSNRSSYYKNNNSWNIDEIKLPLKQIHFSGSRTLCIRSADQYDMALLLYRNTREISICMNHMKDEICIGLKDVEGAKTIQDNSIVVKLKPDFDKKFYHHSEGYPYKFRSVRTDIDPTKGIINGIRCLNFKPEHRFDTSRSRMFEKSLNTMIRQINKSNLEKRHKFSPVEFAKNQINIYVTCTSSTQKRAIVLHTSELFSYFRFHVQYRFGWKYKRMWYKGLNDSWILLKDEDNWKTIKDKIALNEVLRLEVFMK
nr:6771_t:CDS:2 [Entrophospora candida]